MAKQPAEVDLDAFVAYCIEAGAVADQPRAAQGEVHRFRLGKALGSIAMKKSGKHTFTGIAKAMLVEFQGTLFAADKSPPARLIKATLPSEDHARARELLAGAKSAMVYTDGSCERKGVGKGGWAAIIRGGFATVEIYGGAAKTTSNRMEMTAAIVALDLLPDGCAVKINTDSQYLRKGITQWIEGWKNRGWRTYYGAPVLNRELWERLDAARLRHTVKWKWIPSHKGIRENERADFLAKKGRHEFKSEITAA